MVSQVNGMAIGSLSREQEWECRHSQSTPMSLLISSAVKSLLESVPAAVTIRI